MLEISSICLCLFFRDVSILNKIAILGQAPMYVNKLEGRSGSLWEGRYKSPA